MNSNKVTIYKIIDQEIKPNSSLSDKLLSALKLQNNEFLAEKNDPVNIQNCLDVPKNDLLKSTFEIETNVNNLFNAQKVNTLNEHMSLIAKLNALDQSMTGTPNSTDFKKFLDLNSIKLMTTQEQIDFLMI